MKSLLLLILVFGQPGIAQQTGITELMTHYYGIKDALIAGEGATAREHASRLVHTVKTMEDLTGSQKKVWAAQRRRLIDNGEAMAGTMDPNVQRARLNDLSIALFTVMKSIGTNGVSIHYQYCPMKKSYWLSAEKEIRNPYYGMKMLSCGSVKETLK